MPYHKKFSQTLLISLILFLALLFAMDPTFAQVKKKEEKEEKLARAKTEEILVTATAPQEKPLATVSTIEPVTVALLQTRNISEVLSFAPGTYVTVGSKAESHAKIRGLDNDKSTLLLDGIPIYEPYFNLYDLKTIPSVDVESIQITKGSSSVLYGANTLGGIIEVLTRRPQENSLELKSRLSQNSSFNFSGTGSYTARRFSLKISASHDESQGYKVKESGSTQLLKNSDYKNNFFNGKFYFYPGEKSELLLQTSYYKSSYGIPAPTAYYSPRYWRFKDWERWVIGLGGTFPLFKNGTLKIRTYYVKFYNILDSYTDPSFSTLNWESTYDNYEAGAFLLGAFSLNSNNELRFSFNGRLEHVKQQSSITSPWELYEHKIFSAGVEDEWQLASKWHLIGGFSLDHLKKQTGNEKTSVNPIAGLKFGPTEYLNFHLSFSRKSRFPSMRSLYSSTSGNPDLKDESGTTLEFGTAYSGWVKGNLAIFNSNFRDLISVVRQPDGTKKYINIGKAVINGLEVEISKTLANFNFQINYTFLNARNLTDNRRLDLVPKSQASFLVNYFKKENFSLALWVLTASDAEILINQTMVQVPAYLVANISFEKNLKTGSLFFKIENLFDKAYYTEPGYPAACRRVEAGFSFRFGSRL
ncbi:MAG: TonB-dependent receptor [Candidatus Aminicenantes bacterium]|nr:TonB-dependent receptor [Candidatus Aminicenantes bacterium]